MASVNTNIGALVAQGNMNKTKEIYKPWKDFQVV